MVTIDLLKSKDCTECHQLLPLANFDKNPLGKCGRTAKCRPCRAQRYYRTDKARAKRAAYMRERRTDPAQRSREYLLAESPDRLRTAYAATVFRKYGLTVEDVARMFNDQQGLCASCGDPIDLGKLTRIDHCHKTGKVRSLLCHADNTALGFLLESPERIQKLAAYVQRVC